MNHKHIIIVLAALWFIAFMTYPSANQLNVLHEGLVSILAIFLGMSLSKVNE